MRAVVAAAPVLAVLLLGGCLNPADEGGFDLPQCVMPQVDTTGWTRVSEVRYGGPGESRPVSYLVPPTFEQTEPYTWERGGTQVTWKAYFTADRLQYPEMRHASSCRTMISGVHAVFDYGTMPHDADGVVLLTLPSLPAIGVNSTAVFESRMRDHSDRAIIERMFWSVLLAGGGGPGSP